jgi:hypothetical protein
MTSSLSAGCHCCPGDATGKPSLHFNTRGPKHTSQNMHKRQFTQPAFAIFQAVNTSSIGASVSGTGHIRERKEVLSASPVKCEFGEDTYRGEVDCRPLLAWNLKHSDRLLVEHAKAKFLRSEGSSNTYTNDTCLHSHSFNRTARPCLHS